MTTASRAKPGCGQMIPWALFGIASHSLAATQAGVTAVYVLHLLSSSNDLPQLSLSQSSGRAGHSLHPLQTDTEQGT